MRLLARIANRGRHLLPRSRLGVRGLVVDRRDAGTDQILLVRHTYVDGWYLPGGGVEMGESAPSALARELLEETGVEILGLPLLHGFFFNPRESARDHVACYLVDHFRCRPAHKLNLEIAEARFFPIDALPTNATRATRARIDEALRGAPLPDLW